MGFAAKFEERMNVFEDKTKFFHKTKSKKIKQIASVFYHAEIKEILIKFDLVK